MWTSPRLIYSPRRMFLIVIFLAAALHRTLPQNLNSRPTVESLILMEAELIDFCQYALVEEQRLHNGVDVHGFSDMAKFIDEVEPISDAAVDSIDSIADDILQILVLKRRLSVQWAPLLKLIHESEFVKRVPITKRKIESIQYIINRQCNLQKTVIPDIFRLQHYYKLPSDSLSVSNNAGNILIQDVGRVVAAANEIGDHATALQWIKFGLKVSNASAELSTKKYFLNLKAATFLKMKKYKKAEKIFAYLVKSDANSRTAESNLKFVRSKLDGNSKSEVPPTSNFTNSYSMQLCRGNVQPSTANQENLRCFVKDIDGLQEPVKIEEIHLNPRIVMLRQFVGTAEIGHIKQSATDEMMSHLISDRMYKPFTTRLRQYKETQWTKTFFSALMNVTYQGSNVQRDEIFTRVIIENEGPGGLEVPIVHQHWQMYQLTDTLPIANFMLFMNDVNSGGGIAFPNLHLKVEADEGSMLFWQYKTQHGPVHPKLRQYIKCPVIKGNQWVARAALEHHGLVRRVNL